MTDPHDRSARVLDPAYLEDVEAQSVEELRSMHSECLELETEVSYIRRLTQAKVDILEAETERRASGQSLEQLIAALPQMAPEQDSEWAPDLEEFDGVLANLTTLTDTELQDAIAGLRALEREVSDQRRQLFAVIDRIDLLLAAQLR